MQFLLNKQVNKERWDECVAQSVNELVYAKAFYLDNISPGWQALTGENYEWVMPLTQRKKFGIAYLYQPAFTQQTGVFYKHGVSVPYNEILQYMQQHYKFWEINWNFATPAIFNDLPATIATATNYTLHLSAGYENISAGYHDDLIKNLKKSKQYQHTYVTNGNYRLAIQFYRQHYASRLTHVTETDYKNFENICTEATKNNSVICRQVINKNEEILAIALLLFDGKRLYNLMNTTTTEGRRTSANHFLINSLIQEFSGKKVLLDFEGSDLPGVKTFYENFGAVNRPYFTCKYNNLPWPINLFKK